MNLADLYSRDKIKKLSFADRMNNICKTNSLPFIHDIDLSKPGNEVKIEGDDVLLY